MKGFPLPLNFQEYCERGPPAAPGPAPQIRQQPVDDLWVIATGEIMRAIVGSLFVVDWPSCQPVSIGKRLNETAGPIEQGSHFGSARQRLIARHAQQDAVEAIAKACLPVILALSRDDSPGPIKGVRFPGLACRRQYQTQKQNAAKSIKPDHFPPEKAVGKEISNRLYGYMKPVRHTTAVVPAYTSSLGRIRMLAGDPALDFANTLHWRDETLVDFLPDYCSLAEWSLPAGLLTQDETELVTAHASLFDDVSAATHATAIALRRAWRDVLSEAHGGEQGLAREDAADAKLRQCLAAALVGPSLVMRASDCVPAENLLLLPLHRIALGIAGLLLIPAGRRIGRCEGDPCGGYFLDTSRSKPRRWCSMDTCGNRAKVRGFRHRIKADEVIDPQN